MIEARGLSKRYGEFVAVDDVSFEVRSGEVVGFLGPNGAGKTTTMRMLTGFIPPTDGTAVIDGHDIFQQAQAARRAVGYLPETPPLYPEMDVRGYLKYVATIQDLPRAQRREAVDRALERCGLTDVHRRLIGALSKGYRQRVGLAGAIVHTPPVLVLDEPTVGLDPTQIQEIRGLIKELAAGEGGHHAVILSTHILAEVEAICRRVILIHEGRKVVDAPLTELVGEGRGLEEVFARETSRDAAVAAAAVADAGSRIVKRVTAVASRELASLFVSPVAYVVLTLYALLAGFFFLLGVVSFVETLRQAQAFQAFDFLQQMNLNDGLITPFLGSMSVVLIFVIPGVTMGLFASERTNGTDALLTSPLTVWDIVLGKYLAAALFVLILGLLAGFFPALLFRDGDPELGKTAAGLLGLILTGLAYAAVGAFASSLTRSQMIAFILAFVILLLLLIMGAVAELGAMGNAAWMQGFLSYLSVGDHFENLAQGLVDTADLAYFGVVIAVSLLLTKASVESVRWR